MFGILFATPGGRLNGIAHPKNNNRKIARGISIVWRNPLVLEEIAKITILFALIIEGIAKISLAVKIIHSSGH